MTYTDRSSPRWYGIEFKPGSAAAIVTSLASKSIEVFYPTYVLRKQWSDRIGKITKALFPGYLFARFALENRMQVLMTPGVKRILGIGSRPVSVPEEEIASVKSIVESRLPLQTCPYLPSGAPVVIERGPLAGTRGVLRQDQGACWRVVVSVQMLQQSVSVDVDPIWLKPINAVVSAARFAAGATG